MVNELRPKGSEAVRLGLKAGSFYIVGKLNVWVSGKVL